MKVSASTLTSEAQQKQRDEASAASFKTVLLKILQQKFISLYDAYLKVQIYNRGAYSIQSLYEFDRYCSKTSCWQILWYCVLVTLPGLIMEIVIELITLNSPLDHWSHNIVFWVRSGLSTTIVTFSFVYQVLPFVPDVQIHAGKVTLLAITTGAGVLGTNLVLAAYWTFPIPFTAVVSSIPFVAVLTPLFYLLLKKVGYDGSPGQIRALKSQGVVLSLHIAMLIVYNGYNAIFQLLPHTEQVFFIGVLPLLKFGLKNLYAWAMSSELESIPELTTFSVEVFHALFVSICMQTAKSMWASVIFIGIDAIQALLSVIEMESDSKTLLQELERYNRTSTSEQDLIASVMKLCLDSGIRRRVEALGAQQSFRLAHSMLSVGPPEVDVNGLAGKKSGVDRKSKANTMKELIAKSKRLDVKVQQLSTKSSVSGFTTKIMPFTRAARQSLDPEGRFQFNSGNVKLVYEALKLLYHAEYCMMTELVEVSIPVVYVLHTSVLFHLPNRLYYPHTRNMTFEELQLGAANILLYALMEAITLLAFHFILERRFRFSPMKLLGYALKAQWRQIAARSTLTIWFVLGFTLMHYGVDFTFKFDWAEQLDIKREEGM